MRNPARLLENQWNLLVSQTFQVTIGIPRIMEHKVTEGKKARKRNYTILFDILSPAIILFGM